MEFLSALRLTPTQAKLFAKMGLFDRLGVQPGRLDMRIVADDRKEILDAIAASGDKGKTAMEIRRKVTRLREAKQ